ncbi:CobW family GTP-binding protein [Shewanella atlantica]|uniref:GTP-binding protein n=1 Tax=Shewanella atlantica TaxID=271099 RepID=A0A431WBG1_9GAMM|nr:GTP-binding protein [Shewanella atlantica]RTR32812.1 GTP-binding protein [Shewanella atlantica]
MIIKPIATNVITGFLGVGKTSFIKQLFLSKPADEKWAVLINEFGEVGIDAALLGGGEKAIEIREVAGGCMCCAAGIPMQVAINQLIAKAKPDRLLIEPTGLGHPKEVLKVLSEPHYHNVIDLRSTVCLVDARKIEDARYREHEIFNQQLEVADIVLAAKSDLYSGQSFKNLVSFLELSSGNNKPEAGVLLQLSMEQAESTGLSGELLELLDRKAQVPAPASRSKQSMLRPQASDVFSLEPSVIESEFNEFGLIKKLNKGEGFYSCGWVFDLSYEFLFDELINLIKSLDVIRLKAVLITDEGIAGFNLVDGELNVIELDDVMDSRIEIITLTSVDSEALENRLLAISKRLTF